MDTEVDGLLPDEIMEVRLAGDDEEDEEEPMVVPQHEEMMLTMEPEDHVAIISVELAGPAEEAATAPVEVMTRQIAALSGKPATVEAPSRASLATVVAAAAEPTPTVATQTLGQPRSLDTAQAPARVAISRTVATLVSTATTSAAVTTRPVSTVSFATRPVTRTTEPVITMTTPSGQPITAVALSANHKGMSEGGGQVSGMALGGGQQVLLAMLPGSDQPILLTVQPRSEAVQQTSVPQGGGTSTPSSAASKSEPAPMMLTLQQGQGHGQTVQSSPGQGKLEQAVLFSTQGGRTVAQVQSRTQVRGLTAGGGKGSEQPIFLTVQGAQGKGSGGGEGQQVLLAMPPGMTSAQGKAGEGQSVVLAVHSVGKTGTTQTPASSSSLPGQLGSMQVTKMAGPSHSGGSGPIITKFIIKPMPSTGRGTLISGSGSAPGTPTKTFTLSHVTTEGSPGRPQLGGKIAISPLKSPSKMTVMPMSPTPVNSPQKRVVTAMPLPLAVAQQILQQQQQAGSPGKLLTQVKTSGQPGGVKPLSMPMSTMQPISVPGSKFHYVRLVTPVSTHTTQGLPAKPVSSTLQLRPPIPIAPAQRQVVARLGAPSPHLVSGGGSVVSPVVGPMATRGQTPHRLIMPASSLRPSLPGLPPGTLLTPAAGYTMMPAQYITQLQQAQPCVSVSISKLAPLAAAVTVPSTQTRIPVNGITTTDSASRPRKPCNCTKSQCLKLYCECFANGEFCYNCNCRNCSNNLVHESERQRAIKSCLDRNPEAFRPKIGKGKEGEAERRHNKGCHCKRSGCLKNYCECYEAKIMCSSMCKCVGCKNFEESPERKTLMHLADAAEVRVLQQTAAKTKLSSQISDLPTRPPANGTGERLPFNFVTREVAEATCDCLLTVVDEVLGAGETRAVAERRVLQEFGRCLQQIINSAGKVRGNR